MSYRQIHIHIWKDEFFLDLEPQEKLLFIYLFSNDNTTLAGIYKISLKVIAFETGLELSFIKATLDKFAQAEKAIYQDGIMWVINFMRYNASSESPKVKACIVRELQSIPDCEMKTRYLTGNIGYGYHIDTLSLINNNNNNNITYNDNEEEAGQPESVISLYESEIGVISPLISDKLQLAEKEYPLEWIKKAFTIAVNNNARNWNYIEACLKNMKTKGVDWKPGGNGKKPAPSEPGLYAALREVMSDGNQ